MKYAFMKYPIIKCCIILVLICGCTSIAAQPKVIKGMVVESGSGNPVEYAYILNYSLHLENYSNSKGEFRMDANVGDTLVIFAMGYFYKKVIVDDPMIKENGFPFHLDFQPADLGEAKIPAIGTYDDFKRAVVTLNRPLTPLDRLNNNLGPSVKIAAREGYKEAQNRKHAEGFSVCTVPILTPEEKERIKLAAMIEKDLIHDRMYKKFNPALVRQVTGISDDNEIIRFMLYCHFSEDYLLEVNEYDLSLRIALKYELFKKIRSEEKNLKDQENRIDPNYEGVFFG